MSLCHYCLLYSLPKHRIFLFCFPFSSTTHTAPPCVGVCVKSVLDNTKKDFPIFFLFFLPTETNESQKIERRKKSWFSFFSSFFSQHEVFFFLRLSSRLWLQSHLMIARKMRNPEKLKAFCHTNCTKENSFTASNMDRGGKKMRHRSEAYRNS